VSAGLTLGWMEVSLPSAAAYLEISARRQCDATRRRRAWNCFARLSYVGTVLYKIIVKKKYTTKE
jgi:hypothetical protein